MRGSPCPLLREHPARRRVPGAACEYRSDATTRVQGLEDQTGKEEVVKNKTKKNPRAEPLEKPAPQELRQISSTCRPSCYFQTSPPTGTCLQTNTPQQSTSTNKWKEVWEPAGDRRGKHLGLVPVQPQAPGVSSQPRPGQAASEAGKGRAGIQNSGKSRSNHLKVRRGAGKNPRNRLHHNVSKFTKQLSCANYLCL